MPEGSYLREDNQLMPQSPVVNPLMPRDWSQVDVPIADFGAKLSRFLGNQWETYTGLPSAAIDAIAGTVAAGPWAFRESMRAPGSEEAAKATAEAGLSIGMLRPVAPAAPAGSLGMFGTAGSRTADLTGSRGLGEAVRMEGKGASRDEIFDATGWMRNEADNIWRYIISDEGAQLKTNNFVGVGTGSSRLGPTADHRTSVNLDDAIHLPRVFDAYPWMKDVQIATMPRGDWWGSNGRYNPGNNTIYLTPKEGHLSLEMLSTLLHEIQHVIQEKEYLARGGNTAAFMPKDWARDYNDIHRIKSIYEKDIRDNYGANPLALRIHLGHNPLGLSAPSPAEMQLINKIDPQLVSEYSQVLSKVRDLDDKKLQAWNNYRNIAGEVESQATEEMFRTQTWDQPPWRIGGYVHPSEQFIHVNVPGTTSRNLWGPGTPPGVYTEPGGLNAGNLTGAPGFWRPWQPFGTP